MNDPVNWVAEHPAMFFPSGNFEARLAAALVVQEALLSGASDVTVRRDAEWWVIESSHDWLPAPLDSDAFHGVIPFPEAGPNSCRFEILLTAFASDVVTASQAGATAIKGVMSAAFERPRGRVVAFRP
jgi:hypothetical protein